MSGSCSTANAFPQPNHPVALQALAAAEAQQAEEERRAAEDAARRLRVTSAAAAALPPEPAPSEPHATCAVRLPGGERLQRRFGPSDPVAALFDWVDSNGAGGMWPGEYRLVSAYPRRVFEPPAPAPKAGADGGGAGSGGGGGGTLEAAGLAAGEQVALLLEALGAS